MEKKVTIEALASITTNVWQFRVLVAALKLEMFDILQTVHTAKEVADKLKSKTDSFERFLNGLTAMGFVEKKENKYFNKPIAEKYLVKSSPEYYGDYILMNEDSEKSWKELDKVIINGSPIADDNRTRLTREVFTRAMHNNAQAPAKMLSKIVDFSDKKHLLDIGGGSGAFSITLTNKYPTLNATVIEQPEVCKTLKEYIEKEGNLERINILEGDYFKIEFPAHDVALFGQIFHSNSVSQNNLLLKKVYEKLEKNGMVIITEFLLDEDKTGPLFPALFSLNMLKQTKYGKAYTFSEIKSMLETIGFSKVKKQHLLGPHTAIIADK